MWKYSIKICLSYICKTGANTLYKTFKIVTEKNLTLLSFRFINVSEVELESENCSVSFKKCLREINKERQSGVEFRHSTRNASRKWRSVENG